MNFDEVTDKVKAMGDRVKGVGIPWFLQEDYAELRSLFTDRDNLFDTFDEWNAAATQKEKELEAKGFAVMRAIVKPKEFAEWCKASNQKPDAHGRSTYASQKAMEKHLGISGRPSN